jgi:Zn-finger nucleic acid-binding protein
MCRRMTERSGVEIDYCPRYRGIWLDRGELDKIVVLSASGRSGDRYTQTEDSRSRNREQDQSDYDEEQRGGRRERESWFANLFDFGE